MTQTQITSAQDVVSFLKAQLEATRAIYERARDLVSGKR